MCPRFEVAGVDPGGNPVYLYGCRGGEQDNEGSFPPGLKVPDVMSSDEHPVARNKTDDTDNDRSRFQVRRSYL